MREILQEDTVQHTLCIPLWGRMIAARKYPELFPDLDAARIIGELGVDLSGSKLFKWEYSWLNCAVRQYDFSCEINKYLKQHPNATICELGSGLSTLRSQMKNEANPWYNLDMEQVIALREKHIPMGLNEKNLVCDLNELSWFDSVEFRPENGIVFVAGGLFYYFEKDQVRRLFCEMSKRFSGGIIVFDATNAVGLKGVNKEVKMAGNGTKSFFSLENSKEELESWSPMIINVSEKDYMRGYIINTGKFGLITQIGMRLATITHTSFIVHAEFGK